MCEIVDASEAMIRAFSPQPMPRTVRAFAAVEGERVLGVTGFYPQNGTLVLFAGIAQDARAEMQRHRRTLIRCARQLMDMVADLGMPACAYADPEIQGSDVLLKHLGFVHSGKGVYKWRG